MYKCLRHWCLLWKFWVSRSGNIVSLFTHHSTAECDSHSGITPTADQWELPVPVCRQRKTEGDHSWCWGGNSQHCVPVQYHWEDPYLHWGTARWVRWTKHAAVFLQSIRLLTTAKLSMNTVALLMVCALSLYIHEKSVNLICLVIVLQ